MDRSPAHHLRGKRPIFSPVVTCAGLLFMLLLALSSMMLRPVDVRSSQPTRSAGVAVNLNRADAPMLGLLPGIGPSLGQRIIDDRDANGPYATVEDLTRVHGIGPVTISRIRGFVDIAD